MFLLRSHACCLFFFLDLTAVGVLVVSLGPGESIKLDVDSSSKPDAGRWTSSMFQVIFVRLSSLSLSGGFCFLFLLDILAKKFLWIEPLLKTNHCIFQQKNGHFYITAVIKIDCSMVYAILNCPKHNYAQDLRDPRSSAHDEYKVTHMCSGDAPVTKIMKKYQWHICQK